MSKLTIRFLFIATAFILLTMTFINLSIVASQMSDENWYRDEPEGVIIYDVITGGVSEAAGLREGDRLVTINGDTIRSAIHAQSFLNSAKPGESLIYTIERNDRIFDVKVNLALGGLRIWHVGLITSGLLFMLFALFLVLSKPEQKYARILAIGSLFLAFLFMNMQVATNIADRSYFYQILLLIGIAIDFLAIALLGHSSLYFPERKYTHINKFWMIYFHYIVASIMIVISIYIAVNIYYFNAVYIVVPLIYLGGLELFNWKKRRREYLARVKIIKYSGFILTGTLLLTALFLRPVVGSIEYLIFVMCLLPLAYFYTTVRYRVFDIYIRIKLSLVYTTIQVLIFILFFLSIILIIRYLPLWNIDLPAIFVTGTSLELRNSSQLNPELQLQIKEGYLLLFGILITMFLYLFKNRLQSMIDRLFFQQKFDYRTALKRFGELLSSYFTLEEIGKASVEQIHDILKVKGTSLAIADNGQFLITTSKGNLEPMNTLKLDFSDRFIRKMTDSKSQIKPEELESIRSLKTLNDLIYCGTPIFSGKSKLEAILFTGEKLSESAYNNDDLELLNLFAENLGTAFERARLYEQMAEKERLEKEIEIARDIQLNSLPSCDPDYAGLQICSALSAANEVGGDYYDYLEADKNHLGVIVGDVVGKGTSGALHMSKIQGFLQTLQLDNLSPQKMFERLNILIRKNFEPDFFFTALYGFFDFNSKTVNVFRMGHNGLIHYCAKDKKITVIEPGGIGFGIAESKKFNKELKSEKIPYFKDDIFVFLTDGFLEAMNKDQQLFGEKRICEIVVNNADKDASSIMTQLQEAIYTYSSGDRQDDATGIVVKIIK